jgi:hypothetical protein
LLREKPEQDALARIEVDHDKNRLRGPHAGSLGKATCPRSVIVVTHYSAGTIRRCLTFALRELGPKDELIVVDNVSLDDTQLIVHDRVRLLPNRENIGYSRGCNQGILASGGKKLILLNPDVIMAGGSVGRLVAPLHGDVFATGPLVDNVGGAQFVAFHLGGQKPTAAELPGVLASSHAGESAEVKALMGFFFGCSARRPGQARAALRGNRTWGGRSGAFLEVARTRWPAKNRPRRIRLPRGKPQLQPLTQPGHGAGENPPKRPGVGAKARRILRLGQRACVDGDMGERYLCGGF